MLEPLDKIIDGKAYVLSKIPAVEGREILTQYPISATPKIGDYKVNEVLMYKLLSHVGVRIETMPIPLMLTDKNLINNHVANAITLMKLEKEMLDYNFGFFFREKASNFLSVIDQKLPTWITKILMGLSEQSRKAKEQPSMNSEPSTASKTP